MLVEDIVEVHVGGSTGGSADHQNQHATPSSTLWLQDDDWQRRL